MVTGCTGVLLSQAASTYLAANNMQSSDRPVRSDSIDENFDALLNGVCTFRGVGTHSRTHTTRTHTRTYTRTHTHACTHTYAWQH